jgi:hypothetical protein
MVAVAALLQPDICCFDYQPGRRPAAHLLTATKLGASPPIAANIARLPELLGKPAR